MLGQRRSATSKLIWVIIVIMNNFIMMPRHLGIKVSLKNHCAIDAITKVTDGMHPCDLY